MAEQHPEERPDPPPEPPGPFGWPGIGRYLRGPEGLSPLSKRPRDVALRWLVFLGLSAILVVVIGGMILARQAA